MAKGFILTEHKHIVGSETARMLELGHPWVLADRFTKKWPKGHAGDLISLVSEKGDFLGSALLDPGDRIVARVLGRKPVRLNKAWIQGKIEAALRLREILDLDETTAYRLVNGEGDGLPGLTIDRYENHLMVQLFSECWRPYLQMLVAVLQQLLEPHGIYEKRRPQQTRKLQAVDGSNQYSHLLYGEPWPGRQQVRENGLSFLVELEEGLNTGLFFDQRENRRDLMQQMPGKTFLNLFAYTGAFSVAAACAGAKKVTSVDNSASYLEWARENFAVNRVNPKRHEFIVEDCFSALDRFSREKRKFDVILFDPPSFSTTRKSTFSTRGGTAELVAKTIPLLSQEGILLCSSNHQKTDLAEYLKELRRGAVIAGAELKVIGVKSQPGDFPYPVSFPEGRYLKYVCCRS